MKLKVITVTCLRAKNYGAVLQAFALHKKLEELGYDNYLLDYPYDNSIYEKIKLNSIKNFLITNYLNLNSFFKRKQMKKLVNNFNDFVLENFKLTKCYNNLLELENDPPRADIYLTGSDQVFSPTNDNFFNKMRFLDFGNKDIKRVSYAASVGNYNLSFEQKNFIVNELAHFNKLSLREKTGVEYYKSFCPNEYYNHIDPIFLLNKNQWEKYCVPIYDDKYILVFPLLGNKLMQQAIDEIKSRTNLKVISIQTRSDKVIKADKYIYDATPFEFLSYIKNANYVLTTSFHGTAFSILFEKEFYTLVKEYRPQRMECLLKLVGLENRLVKDKFLFEDKIDYGDIKTKIDNERNKSIDYLKGFYDL